MPSNYIDALRARAPRRPYVEQPEEPEEQAENYVEQAQPGQGFQPIDIAKQLRDRLEDDTPDEAIEQGDVQLEARGMSPQQRGEAYLGEAKKQAVGQNAQRRQQIAQTAMDARAKAQAEGQENDRTKEIFAFIGDLANGLSGGRPGEVIGKYRGEKQAKVDRGVREANETEARAYKQLEGDRAADELDRRPEDEAEQAKQIRAIFSRNGIEIPPGSDRAVIETYGPSVAGQLKPQGAAANGGPSYEQKRQDQIDDREDAQAATASLADAKNTATAKLQEDRDIARAGRDAQKSSEKLLPDINRTKDRVAALREAKRLYKGLGITGRGAWIPRLLGSDDREALDSLLARVRVTAVPPSQGAVSDFERTLFEKGVPGDESDASEATYDELIAAGERAISASEARLAELEGITGRTTPRGVSRDPSVTGGPSPKSEASEDMQRAPRAPSSAPESYTAEQAREELERRRAAKGGSRAP